MRKVLITAIVILSLILTALLGFIWYQTTHIFVEGQAYAKNAEILDLRTEAVSEQHYLTVQSQLPDCRVLWNVPFQNGSISSDSTQLTIDTLTEEDIRILRSYFPELQQIDASACTDYEILAQLTQQLPACNVIYQVDLGGTKVAPDAQQLVLEAGSFVFETLQTNLGYLKELQTLTFPKTDLTVEQHAQLAEAYPELAITCTVDILGTEYDMQTTVLDLSGMDSSYVDQVAQKLAMLPNLSEVQLMGTSNVSRLMLEDVQKLSLAAPEVVFHYAFDFYGTSVSTADEEVILKNVTVAEGNNLEQDLRALLDVMENCRRVVLEARGPYDKLWKSISDEQLAKIRADYADKTKMVWRVYFGENGSSLTDAQVIRAVYGLTDDNSNDLVYCENVRYLDVGHNEFLDYMEFLSGMKDLEVAILSGAPLKDLTPIAACKNLKFLELANCMYLPDINALKECTQLEMLNISFTKITDISVLNELNLTHLTLVKTPHVSRNEPSEELQAFIDAHPGCWAVYEGSQPYGVGWRYNEDDKYLPWYEKMVTAFHYPNAYNNIGWYLPADFQ